MKSMCVITGGDVEIGKKVENEHKEIKFPPHEFSNFLNSIGIRVDPYTWRESNEWKIFVAGWTLGFVLGCGMRKCQE